MHTHCLILGGGAAGLCAASYLADKGLQVTILEKLDRVGKKILATGNGRCNLSNIDLNPAYYGSAAAFVQTVYKQTPPGMVASHFAKLGLMTAEESGRIYPRTMAASSVLDVLRSGCASPNVSILTGQDVVRLLPSRRGGFFAETKNGDSFFAPHVLVTMGGSAAPNMGTDGSGTRICHELGHSITRLYPALVQLRCVHPALRSLKGIRVQANLNLLVDKECVAGESGELLFTDYGLSGVCIFQLSREVSIALEEKRRVEIAINFLPEIDDLDEWLDTRISTLHETSAQTLFTGALPRLLVQAILRQANISPDTPSRALSTNDRQALLDALSTFTMPVTGTQGFSHAQVTRGGVQLDEVDPQSMASLLFGGLYFAGEVLDVDGPCGGYNLHFAFASSLTAARSIAGI